VVHLNFGVESLVIQNLRRVALAIVSVAVVTIHWYIIIVLSGRSSALVEGFNITRLAGSGTEEIPWDLAFI